MGRKRIANCERDFVFFGFVSIQKTPGDENKEETIGFYYTHTQ